MFHHHRRTDHAPTNQYHYSRAQHLERDPLAQVAPEPAELLDRDRYRRSRRCAPLFGPSPSPLWPLFPHALFALFLASTHSPNPDPTPHATPQNQTTNHNSTLDPEKEAALAALLGRIAEHARKRGVLLKPPFDDAARSAHSTSVYGHVTRAQFAATLDVKVQREGGWRVRPEQKMFSSTNSRTRLPCPLNNKTTHTMKQTTTTLKQVGFRLARGEAALLAEKFCHDDTPELVNYVCFAALVDAAGGSCDDNGGGSAGAA
jgi:hypothetical protein